MPREREELISRLTAAAIKTNEQKQETVNLTWPCFCVFFAFYDNCDETGRCYMTLDELAERLNLSRSFITKAIKELTAIDAITRKRGEPVKGYWSPASMVTTINKAYF